MSIVQYDPDQWLTSMTRAIGSYVNATINDPDVSVEMSYPDTASWTKETPLDKAIVHFEQDDLQSPILGFGTPGVDLIDDLADPPTIVRQEAVQHLVNFDVGVLVSAEVGGSTKRMELVMQLKDIFSSATGKVAFNEAVGGLWPVSFDGGHNQLDRVNDIPLWRAMGMTLVIRAFSRTTPSIPDVQAGTLDQDEDLVIDTDGVLSPVETP